MDELEKKNSGLHVSLNFQYHVKMWGYFGVYETVTKSVPLKYKVSYCAEVWEKLLDSTEGMWYMYDTFDKVSFEKSQSFLECLCLLAMVVLSSYHTLWLGIQSKKRNNKQGPNVIDCRCYKG